MAAHRRLREKNIADEKVASIDRAAGLRKGGAHGRKAGAEFGKQRIGYGADVALRR